ncbi:enhancer of mRNA-decapping protein 3 [Agrilus planipennis]|uniref:Enhancer of mRNA-decapping protein 3 n=1 Tax=Agrilus planipennis TaxID=224129 RepID=A0A1W4X681_AGRPL|nr:enhancer of mRNA-decapping protein 3 [Agrilus planipennis]
MAQWIGCMVSIESVKGTYQGEIVAATGSEITVTKAFCDGIPCDLPAVTIRAEEISDLKLIEKQESPAGRSTVVVAKPVPKRIGRSTSESSSVTKLNTNINNLKSRPIDIDTRNNSQDSQYYKNFTPNKKDKTKGKWNKGWKDEACFGSPLDSTINKDFDFEKNLALFDKQAIWDEINSQKPDVVKQTDQNRKQSKYRHDENILATLPTAFRQITVPKHEFFEFVTDDGLIIPSISRSLRNKLWTVADRVGLTAERRIELMGRAATEMALQLLGGGHRLNPHNSHQFPTVIILCGPHEQGAFGANAARQLATHGVNTVLYTTVADSPKTKQEIDLYRLTNNKTVSNVSLLPNYADLIIVALCQDCDSPMVYDTLADWTNRNRAPVLALDPPSVGTPGILTKFSLVPVLPFAHSPENGKVYLCNLGFPVEIFNEVGIKYMSPFGSKFFIALHPKEEEC